MNILLLDITPIAEVVKLFEQASESKNKIFTAESNPFVEEPLFENNHFTLPHLNETDYLDILLKVCRSYQIDGLIPFNLRDLKLISTHKQAFNRIGTYPIISPPQSVDLLLNRSKLQAFLQENNFTTPKTFSSLESFKDYYNKKLIHFPVLLSSIHIDEIDHFIVVSKMIELESLFNPQKHLIQEIVKGQEIIADIYVDDISNKPVSIYLKRNIDTHSQTLTGTASFKNTLLFIKIYLFIKQAKLSGPLHLKIIENMNNYYITDLVPFFSDNYADTYAAKVDFFTMIWRNIEGEENDPQIADYPENFYVINFKPAKTLGFSN